MHRTTSLHGLHALCYRPTISAQFECSKTGLMNTIRGRLSSCTCTDTVPAVTQAAEESTNHICRQPEHHSCIVYTLITIVDLYRYSSRDS